MECICSNDYEVEAATPEETVEEAENKMSNEVFACNYVADWDDFEPIEIEVFNETTKEWGEVA